MILFINPLSQFLAKSEKTAKFVFWGVQIIPTPAENKSLQVSGLYYGRLLSYIKHYIDAAIAEMDNQQNSTQQETEVVAFQAQQPQTTKPVAIKIQGDRLDEFTEILENATFGLDFKRSADTVVVGVFGKEFFGVYGIKDNEIWIEYRLAEYLEADHSVDFEKILSGTDIAEVTITDGYTKQQPQVEYTPEESEAYDSVFGEQPPQPAPIQEEKISSNSEPKSEITPDPNQTLEADEVNEVNASETTSSFQKPEPTLDQLTQQLLSKKNKSELEKFKAEIGAEKSEKIWKNCNLVERNLIKCINATNNKKTAIPFDLVGWHDALGQVHTARYIGFYLYGKQVGENERVIYLVQQDTFKTVDRRSLKNVSNHKPCPPDLYAKLEAALSEPIELSEQPTAQEIAQNTFTGLVAPKLPTVTQTGKQLDFEPSKPSAAVQVELDLKTPRPTPEPKKAEVEVTPTPLLELVASEVAKINNTLTFKYEKRGKNMVMEVLHGASYICHWEDINNDLWPGNAQKLKHHGFTEEQIGAISDLEVPKA